ncbi:MAG: alpha/beta hydrolase-fold protein [Acidobacteriota bacterium]
MRIGRMTIFGWLSIGILGGAILAVPAASSPLAAQETDIVIGKTTTIPSRVLGEPVRLDISLPAGYDAGRERYPLLIAFQVQDRFQAVSGIVSGLTTAQIAPPMIVVSAGLDGDLFSLYADERKAGSGGGQDVLKFLREELVPFLEARYRTVPYRIILGHSNSALFGLYALFAAPDLFQAVLAGGPMFAEFDQARIIEILDGAMKTRPAASQYLLFSQGNQPELAGGLAAFQNLLQARKPGGLIWAFHPEPGENHGSVALKTLYDGLRDLFADWATLPETVAAGGGGAIRAYKKSLADRFGYGIGLAAYADFRLRVKWAEEKRYDALISLMKYACEERPEDYHNHLSLALAFQQAGRREQAIAAYETALNKAKENLPAEMRAKVVPRLEALLAAIKQAR